MDTEKKLGIFKKFKERGLPFVMRRELLRGGLTALCSFILGICPLPFSVYPLGVAFFCASSHGAPFALAGLIVASFFVSQDTTSYLICSLTAPLFRILICAFIDIPAKVGDKPSFSNFGEYIHGVLFREATSLRAASAALSAFALSVYPIVSGGFRYYDLFGAILSIAVGAAAVPVFAWAFPSSEDRSRRSLIRQKAAHLTISALICLSLSSLDPLGIDLGLAAAFFFAVRFCAVDGLPVACIAAALCGAVSSLHSVAVLMIAVFTAYCVLDVSHLLSAAVACIAGSVCGIMLGGSVFMAESFPALLLGCAFFALVKKLGDSGLCYQEPRAYRSNTDDGEKSRLTDLIFNDHRRCLAELSAFLPQICAAAELFGALEAERNDESSENAELASAISRRLYELGFGRVETSVRGKRRVIIRLCGERLAGRRERLDFIRRRIEQITSFPLCAPRLEESGGAVTFTRDSLISYHHSIALSPREEVCGDTAEVFSDVRRNRLYALICDGMGSGEAASRISSKSVSILKTLILGGLDAEVAVRRLGAILSDTRGEDELSTTADLLCLDLYDGSASLIKSGSPPSYLIRDGELIRLSARTLPVGIFTDCDYEKIDFILKDGDLLLMVSDGVSECENDSLPLLQHLNSHRGSSPKEMCEDVVSLARSLGREDDVSVIAIKIFSQNY